MILFLGNNKTIDLYSDLVKESRKDTKDIVVSCQYGHLVPKSIINSNVCINIHYGILPFYAGCNPVYWQIIKGSVAGVTIHYMDEDFDKGDIIATYQVPIGDMTADQLYDVLEKEGKILFKKVYKSILNGTAQRKKQDLTFHKYYSKKDADFSKNRVVSNDKEIRALHFKGKQFPKVSLGKGIYEVSLCNTGV